MNWSNISLFQFQEIEKINANPNYDDFDKLLYTACVIYKMTEYQMDNSAPKKVGKYIRQVEKIFKSEFKPIAFKRIGRYNVEYDVSKLTLGQYVELSHFLQGNVLQNAHYILASITRLPFSKNDPAKHKVKSDYFLRAPITKSVGSVTAFVEKFSAFNKEYEALFESEGGEGKPDPFNKRFGWQYSAREVAKDEGITLDEAYNLPIRQALNSLGYLKAKQQFEERQMKNNGR